jgi:hypothetical protein
MIERPAPVRARFRFRLRTLLLLPVVIALSIFLLDWYISGFTADGHKDIEFHFIVVDAATKLPIDNASILEFDPDILPRPTLIREALTDRSGHAVFIEECGFTVRGSLLRTTGVVGFPWWDVVVSREGYVTTDPTPLRHWTGKGRDIHDPTPPSIRIELYRTADE